MRIISTLAAATSLMLLGACGQDPQEPPRPVTETIISEPAPQTGDSVGAYIDDASVTAKVKSALIGEPDMKAMSINVDTTGNVVTLSGTVESDAMRVRAEQVTRGVEGVKTVQNQLIVN